MLVSGIIVSGILVSGIFIDSPIPGAELFKAWVCGRSFAVIADSNPAWGLDICLLCVLCCQVESLCRADFSSREILLSWCVGLCGIVKPRMRNSWPIKLWNSHIKMKGYTFIHAPEGSRLHDYTFCTFKNLKHVADFSACSRNNCLNARYVI